MKAEVIILNYMRYVKKDGNEQKPITRIEFCLKDYKQSNNYTGTAPISCFIPGHEVYEKLSPGLLLRPLNAEFEIREDYNDPLKMRRILKKINGIDI